MNTQVKELVDKTIAEPDRESAAGFHYISYYIENPYGWYLRYVRGYRYRFTKPALTLGGCLHSALEIAYKTIPGRAAVVNAFATLMLNRKDEYESIEQYSKDLQDGKDMLAKWYDTWMQHDIDNYNFLHIEDKFRIPLPNGYYMTVKPDLIVEVKQDRTLLNIDHKSSRYSMGKAHESLAGMDQSTSYLWAISQLYPNRTCIGCQSDVLYKNRSKVDAQRVGIVQRSKRELAEFQLSMIGALSEISQKVKALAAGWPVHLLFPRNGKDESYFGSEWPHIYRAALPTDPAEAPYGYEIDDWTLDYTRKVIEMVDDNPTDYITEDSNVDSRRDSTEPVAQP